MPWDNSPVYRRRRRLVFGGGALVVVGVTTGAMALGNLLSSDTPGMAEVIPQVLPSQPESVNHERTGTAATITIAFGGDTQAHGSAGRITEAGLGETGQLLARADLSMVNLETVVAADRTGLRPEPKTYTFATGPKILDVLKADGVDVVTAANNHGMDFGVDGMNRMLAVKASSPVPIVGIGKDDAEAWAPWTTEVKGRKVVVFGATDVLDDHLDWKAGPGKPGVAKVRDEEGFAKLVDAVKQARSASPDDVIVVYLHSGIELVKCPTQRQQTTDAALAEAGADVVIGSHAHLLQPTTTVGNTAIAYGLGNFVFASSRTETRSTGVLTVTVPGTNGAPSMEFDPARITNGLPVLLSGAEREKALQRWTSRGEGCV